jgi:hypothetical protein
VEREYREGATAPALAEKYGVGVKAVYARACKEGWRKSGQEAAEGAESPQALAAACAEGLIERVVVSRDGRPEGAYELAVALTVGALREGQTHLAAQYALVAESLSRTAARLSVAKGNMALFASLMAACEGRPDQAQRRMIDAMIPQDFYTPRRR